MEVPCPRKDGCRGNDIEDCFIEFTARITPPRVALLTVGADWRDEMSQRSGNRYILR